MKTLTKTTKTDTSINLNEKALSKISKELDRKRVKEFMALLNTSAQIGRGVDESIREVFANLKQDPKVSNSVYTSIYYAVKKYFVESTDSVKAKAQIKEYFDVKEIKPVITGYNIKELPTESDVKEAIHESNPSIAYVIKFLSNTGLRISELISIQLRDISLNGKAHIRVSRLKKKQTKVTTIDLPREFVEEIILHFHGMELHKISDKSRALFVTKTGHPYNRVNLSNQIKAKLGFSAHKLRHFFAHEIYTKEGILGVNKKLEQASLEVTSHYLGNIIKSVSYSESFKDY